MVIAEVPGLEGLVSRDTHFYAVRGHPLLRTCSSVGGLLTSLSVRRAVGLLGEQAVEFSEPVAAAVDMDDVHVVKQAIEDGGGQDLVAREGLGPVAHMLV